MIQAKLSDMDAEQFAEGLLSGYTEDEEDDGTLDEAAGDLAYYLIQAVADFNEERKARKT